MTQNQTASDPMDVVDYKDYEPEIKGLGLFKRGVERWHADFAFRDAYALDRRAALDSAGLEGIDPDELDILVHRHMAIAANEADTPVPPMVAAYRRFIKVKMKHAKQVRDSRPDNDRYLRWRRRMINSGVFSQGVAKFEKVVHAPFAAELSRGCTVNCWFCGVDAGKFEGSASFDEPTEELWRGMLQVLADEIGPDFAQHGFCYWATEPFDNQDYEQFVDAFHDELGYLPQTTTAVAMRDPERTRRLLKMAGERNAFVQRFSVTTKKDFDAIHRDFDPEELLLVELIPQFENRASPKATAGRVRSLVLDRIDAGKEVPFEYDLEMTGSIACVSGFLINVPERMVRLVTPCRATDQWPLGYRILREERFEDAEGLRCFVRSCIENEMVQSLEPEDVVEIRHPEAVTFEIPEPDQLDVVGGGMRISMRGIVGAADLAERVRNGAASLTELVEDREKAGYEPAETILGINRLFRAGCLREPNDRSEHVQLSISAEA
jgi:radical SAM family RiPP maturation amino acid epimerase